MRLILAVFRTFLAILIAIFVYILIAPIVILISFFAKDKSYPFLVATLFWHKALLKASGIKINVYGKANLEHLPQRVVFVANHASYLDIPILTYSLPFGIRFVARDSLFRVPFLGFIMRKSKHISIERKSSKKTMQTIIETIKKVKSGLKIIIFPEGTRSKDGKIQDFKKGSILIAQKADAIIIPVFIENNHKIMPKNSFLIHPCLINVRIGKEFKIDSSLSEEQNLQNLKTRLLELALNN